MTDNEIIKDLESEIRSTEYVDSDYCDGVDLTLIKSAIDLINRQKAQLADERAKIEICAETISRQDAEIERLKRISVSPSKDLMDFCGVLCDYAEELIDKAKSEAIKEFADRLKNEIISETAYGCDSNQHTGYYDYQIKIGDISEYIDNLVKEMVGDTE